MKCPQPKCKGSLGVARTYGSPERIIRARKCPKCHTYQRTVEVFQAELDKLNNDLHEAKHEKDLHQYALENELADIKLAARTLFEAAQEKK